MSRPAISRFGQNPKAPVPSFFHGPRKSSSSYRLAAIYAINTVLIILTKPIEAFPPLKKDIQERSSLKIFYDGDCLDF
jgi:hypothetical protein